jgi:hypothetical protein
MNIVQMRRASAYTYGLSSEVIDYAMQYGVWTELKKYVSTNIAIVPYVNQCKELLHSLVKTDYVPFLDDGNGTAASIDTGILIAADSTLDLYHYVNVAGAWVVVYGKHSANNSSDSYGLQMRDGTFPVHYNTWFPNGNNVGQASYGQNVLLHTTRTPKSNTLMICSSGSSVTATTTNNYTVGNYPLVVFGAWELSYQSAALRGGISRILYTSGGITTILAPYNNGTEWGYLNCSSLQFLSKTAGSGTFSFVLKQRTIYMTT